MIVAIVRAGGGIMSYTCVEDCELTAVADTVAHPNGLVVVGSDQNLGTTDYQGSGTLLDGSYEGVYAIANENFTTPIPFSKGDTIWIASQNNGMTLLYFTPRGS